MKLKDLKNDNHYIKVSVEFDDNEINQIENSSYLLLASRLNPETATNISKKRINNVFGPDYLKRASLDLIMPKTAKFLKENIEEELLVDPALNNISTDDGFSLDLVTYDIPEFKLFNYKEELVHPELKLGNLDDQLNLRLEELQQKNVRLVPAEKPFEEGNTISIDINPDNEAQAENNVILTTEDLKNFYNINDFIEKNIDDEFETNHNGQDITVKINQIYTPEYPELDDDFAAEVSEFDTLDELKDSLKEDIITSSQKSYRDSIEWEDWNQLFDKTELIDTNETLLNYKKDDKFKMIVSYLLNMINSTPVYLPQISNFEFSIYMNLCLEIAKKLLEEEGIDINSQIDSIYEDFLAGNEISEELPTIIIQDIKTRNPESETERAHVKGLIEQGLTFKKTKEALDKYIRLENSQEKEEK